jgi:putative transposase
MMKKSRYNEEQIVRILREADSAPVSEVAKRYGVSEPSIYAWRKRFGQMDVSEVKRLKALEAENARLKRALADRVLEVEILKEVNEKKW